MPWVAQHIPPASARKALQHAPRESWWVTCPREQFAEKVAEEVPRMKQSRFGSIQLGSSEGEARAERRRRLPV